MKSITKLIFVITFGLISGHIYCQPIGCPAGAGNPCPVTPSCELVCNGSFEWVSMEPQTTTELSDAYNWVTPNGASPDLFSTNPGNAGVGIPCNAFGSQAASTNNCAVANHYAGIFFRNDPNGMPPDWTEYLTTAFSSSMIAGKNYVISFYVSKAENLTGQINGLAVYITSVAPSYPNTAGPIPLAPTIVTQNTGLLNNTNVWQRISFCYTATGNEAYLTIGRPAGSSYTVSPGSQPGSGCGGFSQVDPTVGAYLYIDEVSVKLVELDPSPTQTVTPCGTVALTGNFACGSPNVPTISYLWSGGPGTINNSTVLNTFATVTSSAVFSLTVNYQGSIGTGCSVSNTAGIVSKNSNVSLNFPALSCTNRSIFNLGSYVSPATTGTFSGIGVVGGNFNPSGNLPTGVYTITFTYGQNGCASVTKQVFVPAPLSFSIAYNNNACSFKTFTAVPNCPVALQNYTFTWVFGDGAACLNCAFTVSHNYITNGNFNVSCNISGPGGFSQNLNLPITVTNTGNNPGINVFATGTGSVCPGNSAVLFATGGLSTYTWFPPGLPPDLNSFSISVTPSVTTTYTAVSTNSNGCVVQNTVTVYVDPLIPPFTVNYPAFVCNPTNSSTITVSPSANYTLYAPTFSTTMSSTFVVTPNVTTSYTITAYNANGCLTHSVVTIGVVPCECLSAAGATVSGILFQDLAPSTAYKFVNNVTIINNVTFFKDDIVLYPDVKITVSPGATLNILGSHLHGCGDL